MLSLLRGAIFWPFRAPHRSAGTAGELASPDAMPATGFWVRVADLVVNYPLAILSVCLLVLAPLAVVGARTKSNHSQLSDLDPDRLSVIGANVGQALLRRGRAEPRHGR